MPSFDWIVVGNGLTGAALSYELVRQGLSVLLLDQDPAPENATRYSYGGIPYWSGTTDLTRQLCQEGRDRHQALPEETGIDTGFRELDLLLTVAPNQDPAAVAQAYTQMETPPRPISPTAAADLEPQLNAQAIAGALTVRHGQVHPTALVQAYNQGFQAGGGWFVIAPVTGLVRLGDRITGVTTPTQAYASRNVAIAAGGYTRSLLQTIGLQVPVYFTQAELIETPPQELTLRTLIMPAAMNRPALEAQLNRPDVDTLWERPHQELAPPILDAGLTQFRDGTLRIGQISRLIASLAPQVNAADSEAQMRAAMTTLVPSLTDVPGQWRSCLVACSRDGLPLAGPLPGLTGLAVFSGFSSPFALAPAAAVHFARWAAGETSPILRALSPGRFMPAQ